MKRVGSAPLQAALEAPRPESLALLARVAGSLWFFALTALVAQGVVAMVRSIRPGDHDIADWAPAISQACTLIFYLVLAWLMLARRTPVARNDGLIPVTVSLLGTYGVWAIAFLPRAAVPPAIDGLSAAVTLTGCVLIIVAIGYLGRSFSIAPQARALVTSGPYRLVRNPLYLAEEIAVAGALLHVVWYVAIPFLLAHLALQISRIRYEEALLETVFPEFRDYAGRTARFVPGVW